MDAAEDRDVMLMQASAELLESYSALAPSVIRSKSGQLHAVTSVPLVRRLTVLLEPFQESPQLLDPHLSRFVTPLTDALVEYIRRVGALSAIEPNPTQCTLPVAVARLLYTIVKIRGYKIIARFLPNEPFLLEPVSTFMRARATGADKSWELRYVLLIWLSHLLLAPFDLSTISENSDADAEERQTALDGTGLDIPALPSLSRRLLALGVEYLSSPGNRENDAAALLVIRISLRKDMRELGLLDAIVEWGLGVIKSANVASGQLFLKTGALAVLAGILAQGESEVVRSYVPRIYALVQELQDADGEEEADWESAGIRQLGMKIYRHVALISLGGEDEEMEGVVEDVIERLLNSLGDRDTAVRFGASKSLAVVARKLDPDMAGDVLEAVMGIYEEDILLDPSITKPGQKQRKIFTAVSPERWHGATLTLATFLRQRAVRTTEVLEHVVNCIIDTLSFEQRRATFAVGGNVRDAACYAAWSLARNYTTAELLAAGEIVVPSTAFNAPRTIPQILATELTVVGCLDPLGNVRRASSAALQELVGRHPNCVSDGISLVQAVDYSAVALRRRSVIEVSKLAAVLKVEYWHGLVFGLITGWRGVGASDDDGRKLAASALNNLIPVRYPSESDSSWANRIRKLLDSLISCTRTEGARHVEIFHGGLWGLSTLLDAIRDCGLPAEIITTKHQDILRTKILSRLTGKEFINPILRPDLVSEGTARFVNALCSLSSAFPDVLPLNAPALRRFTAIIEASLLHTKDILTEQAILATYPLFSVLSTSNRDRLIKSWTVRTIDTGNRFRGPVGALAEVAEYTANNPEYLKHIVGALISAAKKPGDVEMRVAGVKALTRGIIEKGLAGMENEISETIGEALDDYAVDMRGDVGSWVRAEAVAAVVAMHRVPSSSIKTMEEASEPLPESTSPSPGTVPFTSPFAPQLARIALEKLDRLRLTAATALLSQTPSSSSSPDPSSQPSFPPVASPQFFHHLLSTLLPHPHLRIPVITGISTSTGAGSDSIMKASRKALITYLTTSPPSHHHEMAIATIDAFKLSVSQGAAAERTTCAFLATIPVMLDAGVISVSTLTGSNVVGVKAMRSLFIATQKAHFKSGNIQKLELAVRVYTSIALGLLPEGGREEAEEGERRKLCQEVLKKMASLLLHPFPMVRKLTAEMVWVVLQEMGDRANEVAQGMEGVEWSASVKSTRVVEGVRAVKAGVEGLV